jgi:hypothetical protein
MAQVLLITLSCVVIFAYIRPELTEVKRKQDQQFLYDDAVTKAQELNAQLQSLIAKRDSFSDSDLQLLDSFVPQKLDHISAMRDIEGMFTLLGRPIVSLSAGEVVAPRKSEDAANGQILLPQAAGYTTNYQDLDLVFSGDYADIKELLRMLEANKTLLEVVELSVKPVEEEISEENQNENISDGQFQFSLTLRTFGLVNPT